jgi:protein TonB
MAERMTVRGMEVAKSRNASDRRQSRRMLIALLVLLVALGVTVLRDRDYLFANPEVSTDQAQPASAAPVTVPVQAAPTPAPSEPKPSTVSTPAPSLPAAKPVVTEHKARPVRTFKAEVIHHENPAGVVDNAAQRAPLAVAPAPEQAAVTQYPLLDSSMRVQGSVVLQAMISADGAIEDLHVVSGPAILGSAARQAVLQWRFKPYLENGRAVETQATITVNFTIRVADNSNKTARMETPDKVIILPNS